MKTFKHGDRVTCTINGTEITDARISMDPNGIPFICQNRCNGNEAKDKLGYKFSWSLDIDFTEGTVTDLKLVKETFKPKRGDEVEVSDYQTGGWDPRIFLTEIEGAEYPFICVHKDWEDEFKNGEKFNHTYYKYMRDPSKKTTITKSQIAEKLNIQVEELEIID